ncbi:MAG TPA: hypothetical protein VGF91_13525 [Solirubrobacteraceae bacterium]|jgi:hypothetical protein
MSYQPLDAAADGRRPRAWPLAVALGFAGFYAGGHMVRPGDTVAIQGTEGRGGTIKPTSISDSGDDSTATGTTQAGAASSSG